MPSSLQVLPSVQVFDYLYDPTTGLPIPNAIIKVTYKVLQGNVTSPVVMSVPVTETVNTDPNGYWTLSVVPNTKLNPANSTYVVDDGYRTPYEITVSDVAVPAGGWQSINIVVTPAPAVLPQVSQTVGALTATGLLTASGGLVVSGGETAVGGLTADQLNISTAVSRIVPGVTSLSLRNNANNADNVLVTDAGNVTVRGNTTVGTGLTITAGGITVTAGGAAITGNSTVTGTLTVTSTINGQTISAAASFTGTVTMAGNLTVNAFASVVASAGVLLNLNRTDGAAALMAHLQVQRAGSTKYGLGLDASDQFALLNAALNAINLGSTDLGILTTRNALNIPPSAGGALAATSYGTVPIKFAETLLGSAAATVTFSSIPAGFRNLTWATYSRGDTALTTIQMFMLLNNVSTATYDTEQANIIGANAMAGAEVLTSAAPNVATLPAATATANYFGLSHGRLHMYAGTTGNKIWTAESAEARSDATGNQIRTMWMGKWRTVATAVNRVDFKCVTGNFVTGSYWGIGLEP